MAILSGSLFMFPLLLLDGPLAPWIISLWAQIHKSKSVLFFPSLPPFISLSLVILSNGVRLQEDGPLKITLASPSVPNRPPPASTGSKIFILFAHCNTKQSS